MIRVTRWIQLSRRDLRCDHGLNYWWFWHSDKMNEWHETSCHLSHQRYHPRMIRRECRGTTRGHMKQ